MTQDKISVVVPVYNIAAFLPRCLDSLLAQTHRNIEIVTVDDGSTDRSGAVLDEYAARDARVQVIHKRNEGVSLARLTGIQAASGEYIGFCDGDDEVEPDMYERLLANLKQYDADIAHCGHVVIYPDGREQRFYGTGRLAKQDRTEALEALLSGSFEPGLCNKLYKHSLLHSLFQNGCMDTTVRINEDLLMNYYLFRDAKRSVYEDFCPYHYLKREGSASMAKLNAHHIRDPLYVKRLILDDCKGTATESAARAALLSTALHTYNNLLMTEKDEFIKEKQEVRQLIMQHRADAALLPKKQRVFAFLIRRMPVFYRVIYRAYRRG
ncbi:MAG: glycosyltransferase family 2 protein [Acutalibacteraceae bacterium]